MTHFNHFYPHRVFSVDFRGGYGNGTIQAWGRNVRDFTVPTEGAATAAIPRGRSPRGMAAVAAPEVGTVKSRTLRLHACIVITIASPKIHTEHEVRVI